MDDFNFTAGDLVKAGRILWEETPTRKVWLIRDGDKIIIETEENVDAIIEQNAREEAAFNYSGSHGDIVQVASVPIGLYFNMQKEGIVDDRAAYHRFLNDPDNAKFRTNRWRV